MSHSLRRQAVAVLALLGVFLSVYLTLHRLGAYGGGLLCGPSGGCDVVQSSRWAVFLGMPVAGWGVGWYLAVFATAMVGVHRDGDADAWPDRLLLVLAAGGLLFTGYLTYLEIFVIEAICRWCVASAGLVLGIFALTLPWGRARAPAT